MNILISGCSFTQWPEYPGGPNVCWPKYLDTHHQFTNLGEAAAGNQYICDSVIREVLANPNRYDKVVVMWSGVSRLDYLTSLEDSAWNSLFDSYGFYRRLPGGKLGWIFSGGQMGTWFKHPVAHRMFYEMYKVSSPLSLANINLMEIIKLQNFLNSKKIPYLFSSYVNYWTAGPVLSPNGDFGVVAFPELDMLVKEIDFDKWLFDGDRRCLYDVAKTMTNFMEDGFHPGPEAHAYWANLVNNRIN